MSACGPKHLELTDPGSGLVSGRVLLSEYTGASSLLHVELPGGEIFLVAHDGQTIDADTALGLPSRRTDCTFSTMPAGGPISEICR